MIPPRTILTTLAAATTLALVVGGSAQAASIKVASNAVPNHPGCGSDADPCKSLDYALVNRVTGQLDTISLAAGEYLLPGTNVNNPNAAGDVVVGAGSGAGGTVLKHANNGTDAQLYVTVPLTIRSLAFRIPVGAPAASQALRFDQGSASGSRVEDVAVSVENNSTAAAAVEAQNGAANLVFDHLRVTGNHTRSAVAVVTGLAPSLIQDSTLQGGIGNDAQSAAVAAFDANVVVRRSRLSRDFAAAGLDPVVSVSGFSNVTLESSLVTGGRTGILADNSLFGTASVKLRGVTIDVANPGNVDGPDRYAVRATATGANIGERISVERSILVEPSFAQGLNNATARVDCSDSIVQLTDSPVVGCGAATGNLAAAPGDVFANAVGSDFHLKVGSPAVDGAAASLAADESVTDLDGSPRVLDGNADCQARADRGAYEFTGHAATLEQCTPVVQLPPAVQPPPAIQLPPAVQPPPADPAPVITKPTFARSVFRSTGKKAGTTLRFGLSEAATITLTVERQLTGRRQGKLCVAQTKRNRNQESCERFTTTGVITMTATTGANAEPFSGRVNGKRLTPGRYRARLIAKDKSGKKSAEKRIAFRVIR